MKPKQFIESISRVASWLLYFCVTATILYSQGMFTPRQMAILSVVMAFDESVNAGSPGARQQELRDAILTQMGLRGDDARLAQTVFTRLASRVQELRIRGKGLRAEKKMAEEASSRQRYYVTVRGLESELRASLSPKVYQIIENAINRSTAAR